MKRTWVSRLFMNKHWFKYSFLIFFLVLTFSFTAIHKANADIEFRSKAEYVDQYLQEQNIATETKNKIDNYLDGKDYDLVYNKDTKATSGNLILDTLYAFSMEALKRDQKNFFQTKNEDINKVNTQIESLRTKLKTNNTLSPTDGEFLDKLEYIYNSSRYFFNSTKEGSEAYEGYMDIFNTLKNDTNKEITFFYYSQYGQATNGADDIYSALDWSGNSDVQNVLLKEWRIYLYNTISKLEQDYSSKNINQDILDFVGDKDNGILHDIYDPNGNQGSNVKLTDEELSSNTALERGLPFKVETEIGSQGIAQPIINPETGGVSQDYSKLNACPPDLPFMSFAVFSSAPSIVNSPNCSVVAYLINGIFSVINGIAALVLSLVISLFNWVINFGVTNFKSLLDGSGAYLIYRDVILALVTSLLLPLIFYLIIRMLIDNDTEKIQKMIPKILLTALFVYFSFNVAGWIIDQANIFTLWIYNALSNSSAQGISGAMSNILFGGGGGKEAFTTAVEVAKGDPGSIPVYLVQLVISLTSILVFAQAIALFFLRAIILLLCLIFSPIMVLPTGINDKIDEYKKMVTDKYVNNLILAPVFMFLVLIALKIGEAGQNIMASPSVNSALPTLPNAPALSSGENFLGAAIAGIISIIVLMLAIAVAKKMSGDIGGKISAKISSLSGNLAFGAISGGARAAAGGLVNNDRVDKWIEKGGTGSRQLFNLKNRVNSSTFDPRNSGLVQNITKGKLGAGSTLTNEKSFNQKFRRESNYHQALNNEGKERHLQGLENSPFHTKREIGKMIRNNESPSFKAKLQTDKKFNQNFDKANNQADAEERREGIYKNIDKHFEENGYGKEYFTKQMQDPKNAKTKNKLDQALKNNDPKKRKQEISNIVEQFEKAQPKNKPAAATNPNPNTPPATPSTSTTNPKPNGPAPSTKNVEAQNKLRARLEEKFGTREYLENGQVVKKFDPEQLRRKKEELKHTQEEIYHKKVLKEAEEKNNHQNSTSTSTNPSNIQIVGAHQSVSSALNSQPRTENTSNPAQPSNPNPRNNLDNSKLTQSINSLTQTNRELNNNLKNYADAFSSNLTSLIGSVKNGQLKENKPETRENSDSDQTNVTYTSAPDFGNRGSNSHFTNQHNNNDDSPTIKIVGAHEPIDPKLKNNPKQ